MADKNQITVRFESTLDAPEGNPLLLSGPIELFATVDTFDELFSDDLKDAINESESNTIVVFVNCVYDELKVNENSMPNRGAYFYLVAERPLEKLDAACWQEILLGTHSHENIEILNKLSAELLSKPGVVSVDTNGNLVVEDAPKGLPELPAYIKQQLEDIDVDEPTDSEWNHLDAPLEELQDTYDWNNGSWENLSVGNCQQLYRALIKDNRYLYIHEDMSLEFQKNEGLNLPWIRLYADLINYKTNDPDAIFPDLINNKYLFSINLPVAFDSNNDEAFLFDEDLVFDDVNSYIIKTDEKKIYYAISNKAPATKKTETHKITILIVKDAKRLYGSSFRMDFLNALKDSDSNISLDIINSELLKLYIEGVLYKKPNIPKLYLSTDEYGNVGWDNTLLPAQTFFAERKLVKDIIKDGDYTDGHWNVDSIDVRFENAFFNVKTDFPILLINGVFDFKVSPYRITDSDVIYKLPVNPNGVYFDLDDETDITLIIIKNSAQESISAELARNYVSKEDAVEILSRGKLNLKDYVKKNELGKFAVFNHTHSQYASKGHDHDYRYAMYHHTHPELLALIAEAAGQPEEKVKEWLDEIKNSNNKILEDFIKYLGLKERENEDGGKYWVISDINAYLTEESISALNEILEKDVDAAEYESLKLSDGMSVKDALVLIAKLFEKDIVFDTQVKLEGPIRSKFNIGGIKKGTEYKEGDDLRKILTDLLNPFLNIEEVKELMRPVDIELEWFTDPDGNNPVNINKIINKNQIFYYKIKSYKNINGEDCKVEYIDPVLKTSKFEKTILLVDKAASYEKAKEMIPGIQEIEYSGDIHPYYGSYENHCDIVFTYESDTSVVDNGVLKNDIVYDNYGTKFDYLNSTETEKHINKIELPVEFTYVEPDIIYGLASSINDLGNLNQTYLDKTRQLIVKASDISDGKDTLFVCIKLSKFGGVQIFQKGVQNIGLPIPTQNVLLNNYFDIRGYTAPFEDEGSNELYVLMEYKLTIPERSDDITIEFNYRGLNEN